MIQWCDVEGAWSVQSNAERGLIMSQVWEIAQLNPGPIMTQCWLGISIKAQLQWFLSKPWTLFINRSQKSVEYKTFSVKMEVWNTLPLFYSLFIYCWKPQQLLPGALIKWELSQPKNLIETYRVGSCSEHLGNWKQKGFRLRQRTPGGPGAQMQYFGVW